MQLSENIRGAAFMVGAMTAFTINDAFMKALSDEVHLFQAIFMRGVGVVACLTALCWAMGQLRFDMARRDWGLIVLRSLAEAGGAYFFITALFNMPIANVSAILQSLPLTVSLAGALFLREPLGWRRIVAIAIGFCGVLLIVQPGGEDFNIYGIYAVASVACVTVRDLAVRRMSRSVPSVMVALVAAFTVMLMGLVGSIWADWQPMTTKASLQMLGATTFVIGGYVCSVAAMRVGEISFVAPFRYASLLVALVLGYVVFRDFPGLLALSGAAVVVLTGLFTLYREARLKLQRRVVPDRLR
jgi:S-adenosylmethionine uptake transporter